MAEKKITIPDIGGAADVDVIEVLVDIGDRIEKDDSLITLESEKASMEIPAPFGGVVKEINVSVGGKASEGDVILLVDTEEVAVAESAEQTSEAPDNSEPAMLKESIQEINVPDIGGALDVDVIEVMVSAGDELNKDDSIITLESEKASMEIPAPVGGIVESVSLKVGDKVSKGDLILRVKTSEAVMKSKKDKSPVAKPASEASRAVESYVSVDIPKNGAHAGPAVRRIAREFGIDLTQVKGTARKGRIQKIDVQNYVKKRLAGSAGISLKPAKHIDFSQFGPIDFQPLNKIKKLTAEHTHRAWLTVPHVTQFDEADITELEAFRKTEKKKAEAQGFKLTPLVFIMKAVVAALQEFPQFNASLDPSGEQLILKKYYHIGVAADTPNGLVVPVIRDVDQKGVMEIAEELSKVSSKAREKGLMPKEMAGNCFTISSLGGIGGLAFTPIVNVPDVAILGVSKARMQPVYQNGEFVPRLMLPLSLSYDHRVIDGAEGARFTTYIAKALSDIRQLIM